MIACVIPTYKASSTIADVVRSVRHFVDVVIVVDDACPEDSWARVADEFAGDDAIILLRHAENGGVGAAVKTGLRKALEMGAEVIVKVDADGQMDPAYIPRFVELFGLDSSLVFAKANRFADAGVIHKMPKIRLIGNAVLSLLVKFGSGYWNLLDPTNGYVAFNGRALPEIDWEHFADTYFFEISVLCSLGLKQAHIAEMEVSAVYNGEHSSLSIRKVLFEFPPKLLSMFFRRILLQYFLFDVNLGTLYLLFGMTLTVASIALGGAEWVTSLVTHTARTTGTVMLAVLPFLLGVQLFLNALMYDIQFAPRLTREFAMRMPASRSLVGTRRK